MKTFLVCCGLDGRPDALGLLEAAVRERKPDGLLFAGGVLAREHEYAASLTTEFGHTRAASLFLERFFTALGRLDVFAAVIPGAADAPLDPFLRIGMMAELAHPRLHVVHVTPAVERGVAVFGLGGRIAEYTDTDHGLYSRSLAEYYFRPLWAAEQPRTVLLLPDPPRTVHGEGEARRLAEAMIATYRPSLCVLPAPDGARGADRVAGTLVIRPGM
ncbi:MAG: hypothetical protein ACRC33_00945, partial [Gemmataceae bacterium]